MCDEARNVWIWRVGVGRRYGAGERLVGVVVLDLANDGMLGSEFYDM